MQTIDAQGQRLDTMLFIRIYGVARKTAPARFLTLIMHPDRYKELESIAAPSESVQVGVMAGPMGRKITKVISIKPPMGVSDGVTITQDSNADPSRLVFNLHGIPEIVVENLAI